MEKQESGLEIAIRELEEITKGKKVMDTKKEEIKETKEEYSLDKELNTYIKNHLNSKNEQKLKLLITISQLIKTQKYSLFNINSKIKDLERDKKTIELSLESNIEKEKDEKGKKKFSNNTQRNAELTKRLEENKKYNNILEYLENLQEEKYMTNIEIEYYYNILESFNKDNSL